ncbi:hypothetical protein [Terriglobus aquaticus]|uniref:Zinc-ribbon 15 domain-containing protein n=1 Tax=Terriglobus aquaticus TaxID=940139 RepID=A0ABW9KK35_9BACT|nr:hypothetical protein [Terriglobus aquaticus]
MNPNPLKEPCSQCGSVAWERLGRQSTWERIILPFLNRYPWRCALCNRKRYLSLRHDPEEFLRRLRLREQDRDRERT